MKIALTRVNNKVHFVAKNEDGNLIHIDGAPSIGGENQGFRPMQLILAALAGCSLMDLVSILEKSRQSLKDIQVSVEGDRADAIPAVFTEIRLHYTLWGSFQTEKVERALELAIKKYCSVGAMLEKSATISYTYEIRT